MTHKLALSLIVAMTPRGVLRRSDGTSSWHLPSYLSRVQSLTEHGLVVMDLSMRKTLFEQTPDWVPPGQPAVVIASHHGFNTALVTAINQKKPIFVIGKETWLYESFLPHAGTIHQTLVHDDVQGNILFRALHEQDWAVYEDTGIPRFHHRHDSHKTSWRILERVPAEEQCVQD